jgi:hypothetical protein
MDKKVHLSKMDRPYVGICKNHTDQIKMDKKVHLGEMDFFVHFEKVGHFAPALVIDIVKLSFLPYHQPHPHNNPQPSPTLTPTSNNSPQGPA